MKLMLLGATGLVGSQLLNFALRDSRISRITALTRHPLAKHEKLENHIIDFKNLPNEASFWKVDATLCTLGTTMKVAGSKEAFKFVDHDLPLSIAEIVKDHGCESFILNSAMGANPNSKFFYNKVKGELETNLEKLNFRSLSLIRPGLIGGEREEFRFGEESAKYFMNILSPLLPKAWQINPAEKIAMAMLEATIQNKPGLNIITSKDLT